VRKLLIRLELMGKLLGKGVQRVCTLVKTGDRSAQENRKALGRGVAFELEEAYTKKFSMSLSREQWYLGSILLMKVEDCLEWVDVWVSTLLEA